MFRLFRFRRLTFLPICTCLSHFFVVSQFPPFRRFRFFFVFFLYVEIFLPLLQPIGSNLFCNCCNSIFNCWFVSSASLVLEINSPTSPSNQHPQTQPTYHSPCPPTPLIRTSELEERKKKNKQSTIIAPLAADRDPSEPIIVLLVLSLAAASLVFGATLLGAEGAGPAAARPPACPPAPLSTLCFAVLALQRRVHINHSSYRPSPLSLHAPSQIHTEDI